MSEEATRLDSGVAETRELTRPDVERPLPAQIGRFNVLRELGRGGMGVVYSAYDEELDRRVAIKVLRKVGGESANRMRREAQAMAKLAHPNTATVFEVGTWEGQLYLAMEFVKGRTLSEWALEQPRSCEDVLEVMAQAGRGLQAAHDAGLVHRDFKPDNVMVGDDGRVRVLDFGLAGAHDETHMNQGSGVRAVVEKLGKRSPLETPLTETGAVMGTPRYMSPEQFEGRAAGPKSDQFSFCVSLYELLYEQRPFKGDSMASLGLAVAQGKVQPPPRSAAVPARVREAVLRGLAVDEAERHEDVQALLDEIAGATTPTSRAPWLGVALVILTAGSLGLHYAAEANDAQALDQACREAGREIDETWNDERRSSVLAGLQAAHPTLGPAVAERLMPWLDDGAASWARARQRACTSHRIEKQWDDTRADKAAWCLEDRRLEFDAFLGELEHADVDAARAAIASASRLMRVDRCVDERSLAVMPAPPPEEVRAQVTALRGQLWRARTLEENGQYAAGLEVARATREEADTLAWDGLRAPAGLAEGLLLEANGEYDQAEDRITAAYFEAARAGDWGTATQAATANVLIIGARQARHAEGEAWAEHASMALAHASEPSDLLEAERLHRLGTVMFKAGDYEGARAVQAASLAIHERVLGRDHPALADALSNLGMTHRELADYDTARDHFVRALSIRKAALGEEHPHVAASLAQLGDLADATGDRARAKQLHEQALAIRERTLGAEHPTLADSHNSLGVLAARVEDWPTARAHFQRAYELQRARLGDEHRDLATQLVNLGNVHLRLHEYDAAEVAYGKALAINERARGPRHAKVALTLFNIGHLHEVQEHFEDARRYYTDALDIFVEAYGPEHPRVAFTTNNLGRVELELGEFGGALLHLERGLTLRSGKDTPPEHLAQSQFDLARALWDAPVSVGRDRSRAVELAKAARASYATQGPDEKDRVDAVDAWLNERT